MDPTTKKPDTHLPPPIPNPNLDKTPHRNKLMRAVSFVGTTIQSLQRKSKNYTRFINESGFVKTLSPKKLAERTVKQSHAALPIKMQPCIEVSPPATPQEKKQMLTEAEIAAFPYHRSLEAISEAGNIDPVSAIPNKWEVLPEFIDELASRTGLTADKENGFLYDKKTGLTAYLLHQPGTKEVRLVFGGTTSGLKTGGLAKRSLIANPKFTLVQWGSNIRNALGMKSPKNFDQAKELTGQLKTLLKDSPEHKDCHLVLSGHSKGGAEATYAALSQDPPLEARVFSCAELHQRLVNDIPTKNLKRASELVSVVNIKADIIPNMRTMLPTKLRAIGSITTLKAAHFYNVERHDSFAKHIRHFAEHRSKRK